MYWQALLYWISIIAILITSLIVLYANRKPVFTYYALFSAGIATWLACQFFIDNDIMPRLSIGLGLIVIEATVGFFIMFSYSFPDRPAFPRKYLLIAFASLLLLGPFSFSSNMTTINEQGSVEYGWLYTIQTILLIGLLFIGLSLLIRRYFKIGNAEKGQLRLLLIAFIPFLAVSYLTGVTFADNENLQFLRPLSALIMVLIIVYAMARKKLFNIRSFVVRATAYTLTTVVLAFLYIGPIIYVFMKIMGLTIEPQSFILAVLVWTVVATNYGRVRRWFNKLTNRIFFQDAYEPADLMSELNKLLIGSVEAQKLVSSAVRVVNKGLKPEFCYFILLPSSRADDSPRFIGNNITTEREKWLAWVLQLISKKQYKNSLMTELLPQDSDLRIGLLQHDVAASVKLISPGARGELLGYMIVGVRKSGKPYEKVDTQVLESVASTLTIALQNALHFEEIQQFNKTLEKRIEDATRQLKHTNEKLKALDEAKDDFVSMASHQLRTPLTSVKGYLSMVLEGDAGEITEPQRLMLDQAFTSSQRMTYLIADLLNLSRLKTGKFVIENTPVKLASVIAQEASQVQATAEARSLTITYEEPQDFPILMLDETKIRQVIMNFLDNAIYYTPAGGEITVKLEQTEKSIEFTVHDTGIGVPVADQHNLFTKFYRAANARQARPDGTGLGLFMARKVIVAQGGAIIFRSQAGKGSTFGFSFPKGHVVQQTTKTT